MKFFLSNSEDLVDPNYNFLSDEHSAGRDRWRDDVYPYEVFSDPICDGIFLSGVAQSSIKRRVQTAGNVHAFLRLSQDFPVMGDCGAFNYKDKAVPPYETGEILEIYQHYGYTLGASIDHLVNPKSPIDERQRRWDITIRNAEDFIIKYHSAQFTFTPVGVAQGWDPLSYRQAVEKLLELGYKYIAIGGVTWLHTKYLKPILEDISVVLPSDVDLHLLGIARLSDLSLFQHSGVTSMNGSTPIRQGARGGEYWTLAGKKYKAIRVPLSAGKRRQYQSSGSLKRLDDIFGENGVSEKEFVTLEQRCLTLLRAYDKGEVSLDEVLETILWYNRLNGIKDHRAKYEQTLRDRPWQACPCEICRDIGIEAIVFRDNNRNRRRGFHNTWVFYRKLCTALEGGR